MNRWKRLVSVSALLAALPLISQRVNTPPVGSNTQKGKNTTTPTEPPSDGERVFEQNCSRCHNAPQGFPPQISGTIVRHMRVRASLSKKDEQAILRFLNP